MEKDSRTRGENIKNCGQPIMFVRTPEGFVRKSTWQVPDVRRPGVGITYHPGWE